MRVIGGTYRNRTLATPKGTQTRPTSGQLRECLFNICQSYIEGARFLDLFAGSGAVGIEALSRGASHATFIDASKEALACIRKNIESFGLEDRSVILGQDFFQGLRYLSKHGRQFDIIFSDPPYSLGGAFSSSYNEKVLKFVNEHALLSSSGILFLENPIEAPLLSTELKAMILKDSRRLGCAILEQYVHII
jgi:16S rRNA (guanine966-N2)-methyltransferase